MIGKYKVESSERIFYAELEKSEQFSFICLVFSDTFRGKF
jgi:hypothetical protein